MGGLRHREAFSCSPESDSGEGVGGPYPDSLAKWKLESLWGRNTKWASELGDEAGGTRLLPSQERLEDCVALSDLHGVIYI